MSAAANAARSSQGGGSGSSAGPSKPAYTVRAPAFGRDEKTRAVPSSGRFITDDGCVSSSATQVQQEQSWSDYFGGVFGGNVTGASTSEKPAPAAAPAQSQALPVDADKMRAKRLARFDQKK
mmetsp:Transcript_109233/g.189522  ORF Transcript_109233/g.189522 Transcript_109233/m.189522 type:complete len:122 (+) Transcript_109233:58-423(+)